MTLTSVCNDRPRSGAAATEWERTSSCLPNNGKLPYIPNSVVTASWLGELLGRGQFCEVRKVKHKKAQMIMAAKELSNVYKKQGSTSSAAADLVREAKLLHSLRGHENIIDLYGVSLREEELSLPKSAKTFRLYLEYLPCTLEDKIKKWRSSLVEQRPDLGTRIATAVVPTARAMAFLHRHNILYRDLKPQNIGFSPNGTLKLFDFGLASELDSSKQTNQGHLGTPEYMAPEAGSISCGLPADVFSFAIVMFEVFTLQRAYKHLTLREWYDKVVDGNERPQPKEPLRPSSLQTLMEQCWAKAPADRPTFAEVVAQLETEDLPEPFLETTVEETRRTAPLKRMAEKAVESLKSLDRSAHRAILNLSKHSLNLSKHGLNLSRHGVNLSKHGRHTVAGNRSANAANHDVTEPNHDESSV